MSTLNEWFCACGFKGTFKAWAEHLDGCPHAVPMPDEPDADEWKQRAEVAEAKVARVRDIHMPDVDRPARCCACERLWPCLTFRALADA